MAAVDPRPGAGILDAKKALTECDGDMDKADGADGDRTAHVCRSGCPDAN